MVSAGGSPLSRPRGRLPPSRHPGQLGTRVARVQAHPRLFFFLMTRPPPRPPLFPSPPLFRSARLSAQRHPVRSRLRSLAATAVGSSLRGSRGAARRCVLAGPRPRRRPGAARRDRGRLVGRAADRKSTRLNSSHLVISYAVFCL